MPKRVPTPPLLDDDADYYTVCQPYPLNFDWDIHEDVLKHVRWIAACVGTKPFYAFHYKPKAPSMVIVEVEKNNTKGKASFLGEHRWKELLLAPTPEERDRVTRVFPCFHTNNRSVVKDGWHRVAVNDDWFKEWTPVQDFMQPYPATHYCDPPIEDRTNKALCRPLPACYKPPPAPPAKPVVGSTSWVNAKTNTGSSTSPVLLGAWGRGRGINHSIRNGPKAPPSRWNQPVAQNSNVASSAAWGNNCGGNVHSQEASSGKPLTNSISKGPVPSRPPGLPAHSSSNFPTPPGVMRAGNFCSGSVSNATQQGSLDKQVARISLTENHEADAYTLGDGLDDDDLDDTTFIPRYEYVKITEPAIPSGDDASGENLWPAAENTSTVSVDVCPIHGRPNCKPGICAAAHRKKERARASSRGAGRGRGRGGRGSGGRGGSASSSQSPSPILSWTADEEPDPWS